MKELKGLALKILARYGSVILFNEHQESKVLYTAQDVAKAFKLAQNGAIEPIVSVH